MKQPTIVLIGKFVLNNLVDLATIAAAGFVFILHQVHPYPQDQLLAIIVGLLALMGISGLWERNRHLDKIERIAQDNYNLVLKEYGETARASTFFVEDSDLLYQLTQNRLEGAKQVYLSGMSLRRTVRTLQPVLEKRITEGTRVRFMILDHTNQNLMQELVLRSAGSKTSEGWQEALKGAKEDIQTVVDGLPAKARGSLEFGYLPFIPSFGMAIINPKVKNSNSKVCYVELYHHKSTLKNPTFIIRYKNDEHWYKFFVDQYDVLWKSCVNVEKLY